MVELMEMQREENNLIFMPERIYDHE